MPNRFWRFAYASACFLYNHLPNSQCLHYLPHQRLFGQMPSISTLYTFGTEAIIHIPVVQQSHKLSPRRLACCLLKPLISGGWLLWDPVRKCCLPPFSIVKHHRCWPRKRLALPHHQRGNARTSPDGTLFQK
ncbi:hypothetical protein O181_003850 [Austropuccinia psidii MF-1]|uniref:Uncharacterized protein n=1 Tax=Austropuccinia psidii MF-1 TaxID=1389203 RepID=A0A9Q3BF77_9BASI|nr:hypothetical protein [Austropuccinia psidii MF-1]